MTYLRETRDMKSCWGSLSHSVRDGRGMWQRWLKHHAPGNRQLGWNLNPNVTFKGQQSVINSPRKLSSPGSLTIPEAAKEKDSKHVAVGDI